MRLRNRKTFRHFSFFETFHIKVEKRKKAYDSDLDTVEKVVKVVHDKEKSGVKT